MFGNPSAERMAIEMTYEDTASIYRTAPQTGADGITKVAASAVYQGIICGLSRSSGDGSGQTNCAGAWDSSTMQVPLWPSFTGAKLRHSHLFRSI